MQTIRNSFLHSFFSISMQKHPKTDTKYHLALQRNTLPHFASYSFFCRWTYVQLDPRRNTTSFKRKTLHRLGLGRDDPAPVVVVFHVHLIAYHPNLSRAALAFHLKRCIPGFRRTQARPLSSEQAQTEALDHLTRYMVKSLPPESALFGAGSTLCRPANPKALRLYNKLLLTLTGKKGECVIR
jgi:hypothetical protein